MRYDNNYKHLYKEAEMSTQVELLTYITRERLRSIWSHVAPYLIHIKNFAMWIWPLLVRAVKFLIRVVKFLLRSTLLVTAFVGAYFMSLMLHAEGHRRARAPLS